MTRHTPTRHHATAGLTAAAVAFLVGCSSGSSTPTPSSAASQRTTVQSAASTSATADPAPVLAAYRGYWAARVKAQAAPDQPPPAELDTYAEGAARSDVVTSLALFRRQGIAFRGEPALSPVATLTSGGTATVADCVDSSRWTPVFVDTGTSALAPGQPLRVQVDSTARLDQGRWMVDTSTAHRDRPC